LSVYPLLAVVGGLFLAFAVVEWLLSRQEENPDRRRRVLGFAAAGGVSLLAGAVLAWPVWSPARTASPRASAVQAVSEAEARLAADIAYMEGIARGEVDPTLKAIQEGRRRLLQARRSAAERLAAETPARALESQAETALGVAYHTLGTQWGMVKAQQWQNAAEREKATNQLRQQLARWYTIRDCQRRGRSDCMPAPELNSRQRTVRNFNRWLHAYAVELVRFEERDPDLVDSSAWETKRLREVLARARRELAARPMEDWAAPVVAAADRLLAAGELAATQESVLILHGRWDTSSQEQAFVPVMTAWEQYFQTTQCVTGTRPEMCGKSRDSRS